MKLKLPVFCTFCMFLCAPVFGHHSISGTYFTDQSVRIEGNLVSFNFRNPHSFVEIEGTDPKTGQPTQWGVEWASSKRLNNEGVTRESLKPGDHVIIIGNPSRTASDKTLHLVGIKRTADGWKWGRAFN